MLLGFAYPAVAAVCKNCANCACGIVAVLQIIAKATAIRQGVNGNSGKSDSK